MDTADRAVIADDIKQLSDEELKAQTAAAGDELTKAAKLKYKAEEKFGPLAAEGYRRRLRELLPPEAAEVRFVSDQWDNGFFYGLDGIYDSDGNLLGELDLPDELDISEMTANLTAWQGGNYYDELVLPLD